MGEAARSIFDALDAFGDVEALVEHGETEGLYIECKAPGSPQLSRDQKAGLAQALSGFANTSGGIVIWGASTTKHSHSGLDVISGIEPIGRIAMFASAVQVAIPTLTTPALVACMTKVLLDSPNSKRGVALTLIPQTESDPVQTTTDNRFYFRSGDGFTTLPYEMLKRLFAATETPDLVAVFRDQSIELRDDGSWRIPIVLENHSSAVAEHSVVTVLIENADACDVHSTSQALTDQSHVNPGQRLFIGRYDGVVHRHLGTQVGELIVRMKGRRRVLRMLVQVFANRMRTKQFNLAIDLKKGGVNIQLDQSRYLP